MIKLILLLVCFTLNVRAAATESENIYSSVEKNLAELEYDQVRLGIEKKEIESQISELQKKISERKIFLLKRLKAQSRLRGTRWGELLIKPDLNELNRNMKILDRLNSYDSNLYKEYSTAIAVLKMAKKNLSETEKTLIANKYKLEQSLDEFKKLEQIRIRELMTANSDSLLLQKGKLSRPLDRKPDLLYGNIRDESNLYFLFNRGLVFFTDANYRVKSVGPGVVIFSDLMPGGRETLVIQHSDNYYTVYSGLNNPLKKVGQKVERGEVIARTDEGEFYFEIRHFGQTINPNKWFEEKI
jgi:septal ring factor EnvC (AmiA/AmiB activator)